MLSVTISPPEPFPLRAEKGAVTLENLTRVCLEFIFCFCLGPFCHKIIWGTIPGTISNTTNKTVRIVPKLPPNCVFLRRFRYYSCYYMRYYFSGVVIYLTNTRRAQVHIDSGCLQILPSLTPLAAFIILDANLLSCTTLKEIVPPHNSTSPLLSSELQSSLPYSSHRVFWIECSRNVAGIYI